MHNNPLSGKWRLCDKPINVYIVLHSFMMDIKAGYRAKDYLDVLAELKYAEE